jgi:hypothetical protein
MGTVFDRAASGDVGCGTASDQGGMMTRLPCAGHSGRPTHRILMAFLLAGGAIASSASAATTYRIVVLPLPAGNLTYPTVSGINNAGDLVGYASHDGGVHAIKWSAGHGYAPSWLPDGTAKGSYAYGINNAGDIVGQVIDQSTDARGVVWRGTRLIPLRAPRETRSEGRHINDQGTVLGNIAHPFTGTWDTVWREPSVPQEHRYNYLHGPFDFAIVRVLNDSGILFGAGSLRSDGWMHGFRLLPGSGVQLLDPLPGLGPQTDTLVEDANDAGVAVGYVRDYSNESAHALMWNAERSVRDLGRLPIAGCSNYSAHHINNARMVTGIFSCGGDYQSFVWTPGSGMRSIVDLIDPLDPLYPKIKAGASIDIKGINDAGVMAAVMGNAADPPSQLLIVLVPQAARSGR